MSMKQMIFPQEPLKISQQFFFYFKVKVKMHILTRAFGKILGNKFFISAFLAKICLFWYLKKNHKLYEYFKNLKKNPGSKCLENCNKENKIMMLSFIVSEKKEHKLWEINLGGIGLTRNPLKTQVYQAHRWSFFYQ